MIVHENILSAQPESEHYNKFKLNACLISELQVEDEEGNIIEHAEFFFANLLREMFDSIFVTPEQMVLSKFEPPQNDPLNQTADEFYKATV